MREFCCYVYLPHACSMESMINLVAMAQHHPTEKRAWSLALGLGASWIADVAPGSDLSAPAPPRQGLAEHCIRVATIDKALHVRGLEPSHRRVAYKHETIIIYGTFLCVFLVLTAKINVKNCTWKLARHGKGVLYIRLVGGTCESDGDRSAVDHWLASCKPANANLSRLKERNQTHVVLQISRDISFSLLACCMCCRCLICKDGCWVHRSNNKHMEYVLISCPLANSSCKQLCQ
jgi:hypothetical protein